MVNYGNVSGATGPATAITSTAKTDIGPTLTIPAGVIQTGTSWAFNVFLNMTAPGTASAITTTWNVYLGGIGGTSLVSMTDLNAANHITQGTWLIQLSGSVYFTSPTAATTILRADGAITSDFNTLSNGAVGSVTGLVTTSSLVLTLAWTFSATTGSPSVTPESASAWRVA